MLPIMEQPTKTSLLRITLKHADLVMLALSVLGFIAAERWGMVPWAGLAFAALGVGGMVRGLIIIAERYDEEVGGESGIHRIFLIADHRGCAPIAVNANHSRASATLEKTLIGYICRCAGATCLFNGTHFGYGSCECADRRNYFLQQTASSLFSNSSRSGYSARNLIHAVSTGLSGGKSPFTALTKCSCEG